MHIEFLDSLHEHFYEKLKPFELIMVGEMHGTKEPSLLVKGLAELIAEKEESVSIGLEIPKSEVLKFLETPSDSTLLSSIFFSKKNIDGRNGEAWFDLIHYCTSNPKINLFFFDNYQSLELENRDSSMYVSIIEIKTQHPKSKIITISGNIHNWLIPYRDKPTMGNYCINDTINFSREKICSINHIYSEGTMLSNKGNGLELRSIEFKESVYSESVDSNQYLLFYQTTKPSQYNCILYTRKVSHSEEIKKAGNKN